MELIAILAKVLFLRVRRFKWNLNLLTVYKKFKCKLTITPIKKQNKKTCK